MQDWISGPTGAKAIIFDLDGGIVSSGYKEYTCYYPKPAWVEQDADELIQAVFEASKQAIAAARINPKDIIEYRCASTQRACSIFVDQQ